MAAGTADVDYCRGGVEGVPDGSRGEECEGGWRGHGHGV